MSLHETGDYRYAFTAEKAYLKPAVSIDLKYSATSEERIERRWSCQRNIANDITLAIKVRFPTQSLKPRTGERYDNKKITWVPAAPAGAVTQLLGFICDEPIFSGNNFAVIWSNALPNGKHAVFGYGYDNWYEEEELHTKNIRRDYGEKLNNQEFRKKMLRDELGFGEFRLHRGNVVLGFAHTDPTLGCLILWEVSLI